MIRPFYSPMKIRSIIAAGMFAVAVVFAVLPYVARATQADDTTIRITGYTPGATPFISNVHLVASDTSVLKSIQFTVNPKANAIARPLSATYANYYLVDRGFENQQTGEINLPVYGLYDGYSNIIRLTYRFMDGSSKGVNLTVTTATFNETCGYKNVTRLQPRGNVPLSYDYFMIKSTCSSFSPAVIDSDGALRWVGTAGVSSTNSSFFNNAFYILGNGPRFFRIELDGAFTQLADYSAVGVRYFHHNMDPGKTGLILDANTQDYYESVNMEVDPYTGAVLKTWNLAEIISAAMRAGGDDPSQFVYTWPTDWFHNNSVAYNRADDSIIVSSRENFLICLDYDTGAIKWILGDPTKKWYQFPSLRRFALTLTPGSRPPIGQHAISVTFDQNILLFDNGQSSILQVPRGEQRNYSAPRKYKLDLVAKTATEVWSSEFGQSLWCPYCGSVYEDGPFNYLIDFTFTTGVLDDSLLQMIGLNGPNSTAFRYQYHSVPGCLIGFNAFPIHLENTMFPAVGPEALNLSTRGTVSRGDNVLINGFIITGSGPKTVILRALGPSLADFGVSGALPDPALSLYDSSHHLIATNDNWQTDHGSAFMAQNGFAPDNPAESATLQTLVPGAYTVVVRGRNGTEGVSLAEIYRLYSPGFTSKLYNISGRGFVGTGDNLLISGFIVGDVGSATVVVRALGPSLGSFGVDQPLSDPVLTIYDSNGAQIALNDNWRDDNNSINVQQRGLAPPNPLESAIVLHLPAGAYTAVVRGANGATGNALVEVYHIN